MEPVAGIRRGLVIATTHRQVDALLQSLEGI